MKVKKDKDVKKKTETTAQEKNTPAQNAGQDATLADPPKENLEQQDQAGSEGTENTGPKTQDDGSVDPPADNQEDKTVSPPDPQENKTKTEESTKKQDGDAGAKKTYSFPTKSRCPRCRGTQTTAYATKGKVQYRQCMQPVCRHKYTVIGQSI